VIAQFKLQAFCVKLFFLLKFLGTTTPEVTTTTPEVTTTTPEGTTTPVEGKILIMSVTITISWIQMNGIHIV
jgi:hypothetical protein